MNKKLADKKTLALFDKYPRGSQRYKGKEAVVLAKFYVRGLNWLFYVLEAEPVETEKELAEFVFKWKDTHTYQLRGIAVNINDKDEHGGYEDYFLADFETKEYLIPTEVTPDGRQLYERRKFERDDDWTGKKHVYDIEGLNMLFDDEEAELAAMEDRHLAIIQQRGDEDENCTGENPYDTQTEPVDSRKEDKGEELPKLF